MLGLPHQTVAEVLATVEFCAGLEVQHISAYMLKLEEGTPFAARYTEADIDEEVQREIYLAAAGGWNSWGTASTRSPILPGRGIPAGTT